MLLQGPEPVRCWDQYWLKDHRAYFSLQTPTSQLTSSIFWVHLANCIIHIFHVSIEQHSSGLWGQHLPFSSSGKCVPQPGSTLGAPPLYSLSLHITHNHRSGLDWQVDSFIFWLSFTSTDRYLTRILADASCLWSKAGVGAPVHRAQPEQWRWNN